ncbi:MAG: 50S ribosomal protein L18 [Candidatus Omnitrophica bacterium]|nr:50S ribosomal protein L18 [Candidatus Omnitrophota bacterium]
MKKIKPRIKRYKRVRLRLKGDASRPRLVVYRSLRNLSAQVINDTQGKTLFSLSTNNPEVRKIIPYGGNIKAAELFGEIFFQRLKEKGIQKIVFDRAGYLYHGRIKAFAEALRKRGVEF